MSDEARREAERRWPGVGRGVERETLDRSTRYGFVSGAEWQAARDAERIEALEAELAKYREREAASEYALGRPASMPDMSGKASWTIVGGPHSNYWMMLKMFETRPEVKGQPVTILTRRVGPWEAVGDDDQ